MSFFGILCFIFFGFYSVDFYLSSPSKRLRGIFCKKIFLLFSKVPLVIFDGNHPGTRQFAIILCSAHLKVSVFT